MTAIDRPLGMPRRDALARDLIVGVDIGGTKVAVLAVDGNRNPIARAAMPSDLSSPAATVAGIVAAIRETLESAGAGMDRVAAVGVGVPGRVDPVGGIVRGAVNLDWEELAVGPILSAELGVPVLIENDVRLAAAGLLDHKEAGGASSLAYVAVGTGIGAGLILDGQLYRGVRDVAGEIGHVVVEPGGYPCRCGQRGCLETVASGPAIARQAQEALANGAESSLRAEPAVDSRAVYRAAEAGDLLALSITEVAGGVLARSIAALVITCDLEVVLLGGGVAAAGETFLRPVLAELDRLRAESAFISELLPPGSVRLLPPHFDAVAWGGIALARQGIPIHGAVPEEAVATRDSVPEPSVGVEEVVARQAPI
jgi:glucokinase